MSLSNMFVGAEQIPSPRTPFNQCWRRCQKVAAEHAPILFPFTVGPRWLFNIDVGGCGGEGGLRPSGHVELASTGSIGACIHRVPDASKVMTGHNRMHQYCSTYR